MIQVTLLQYIQIRARYSNSSYFLLPYLAVRAVRNGREACWKDFWSGLYAVTGLGALGSLTETLCLCPEYSPINEPSSLNSLPPSAYSTRLSLLTLSTATSSPFRERLPFSGFSSLSLPSTTTGDGCSGSAHKQTHYSTVRLADVRRQHARGTRRPLLPPTLSHIAHTCAHTITGLYTAYRLLNAWLL